MPTRVLPADNDIAYPYVRFWPGRSQLPPQPAAAVLSRRYRVTCDQARRGSRDAQDATGRYTGEPPVPFTWDIIDERRPPNRA
jgi:hypothetical protein